MGTQSLTIEEIEKAAESLKVETAALRAVLAVESLGSGFLSNGKPVILFEAHIFSGFTKGAFDKSHPGISSANWNRKLYRGGLLEWPRLEEAITLNREAALKSASWGLAQLMGFNHKLCGYETVEAFVAAMHESEAEQLDAFVEFLIARKLDDELRSRSWAAFAAGYNGPAYAKNKYDARLAAAYKKFSRG